MEQPAPTLEPTDAILTVPNLLTFLRLGMIGPFLWLALGPDRVDLAALVAFAGLATDLIDGKIARRYGQVTKLGIALDPLSDRLGLAAGAAVLIVHDLAPLWAILAVVGRDALLVVIGAPLMKARGIELPPVSKAGKWGSFAVSLAFGLFLASAFGGVDDPARPVQIAAWVFFGIGVPMYWAAGAGYVRTGLVALRTQRSRR